MKSNHELVQYLKNTVLRSPRVIGAFEDIDRADFVQQAYHDHAYDDTPLPLLRGQTISQPAVVAFMLELLDVHRGQLVLDVGAGSGWTTTLLAHIVGRDGEVVGVEILPELVELGKKNLERYRMPYAYILQAEQHVFGKPEYAPYDRILVSAASDEVPQQLYDQLAIGGIMVIPVRSSILRIEKTSEGFTKNEYMGFAFVPLQATA